MALTERIWIAWEHQRRSKELAKALDCSLYIFADSGPLRYPKSIGKTLRLLLKERPRVVFVQNPSMVLAALVCLFKCLDRSLYVVVDRHTTFCLNRQRRFSLFDLVFFLLNGYTLKKSDLTIVTNRFLADIVEKKGGRPFILPDRLPMLDQQVTVDGLGSAFNVLLISSYADDEPIEEVFAAMAALREQDVHLYITGNDRKLPTATLRRKPENVTLTGFITDDDFNGYLNAVDCSMILTSADHCMLCGCYESVSVGKPFITSDKEVLKDYFAGATFVDNTAASIRSGILSMIDNYAANSQKVVAMKHAIATQWDEVFAGLSQRIKGGESDGL